MKCSPLINQHFGKAVSTPAFLLTFGFTYVVLATFSISVDWLAIDTIMFHTTPDSNWQILAIGATLAVASEVIVLSLRRDGSNSAYAAKKNGQDALISPRREFTKRGETLARYTPLLIASIVYLSTLDRFTSELLQQNLNAYNITGFDTAATFVFTLAIVGVCLNAHNAILSYADERGSHEINN